MKKIILDQIRTKPDAFLTYDQYISLALYHPDKGYYMREQSKIGREGDFYTTPAMAPVFGEFLGKWLCRTLKEAGLPPVLAELGGGSGQMAANVLKGFKKEDPLYSDRLIYRIVEGSAYHQAAIRHAVGDDSRVQLYHSVTDLPSCEGIIFSNEFFDAHPVKVAVRDGQEWLEAGVSDEAGELTEAARTIGDEKMKRMLREWSIPLHMNRVEIPLQMIESYETAVHKLTRGYMLTIDYGMERDEQFIPLRKNGTLRAYRNHRLLDSVLDFPGEADITFNVPFDLLRSQGETLGLEEAFWGGQAEFLIKGEILNELAHQADFDPFSPESRRNRQIRQLIMGESISDYFRVLLQSKGIKKP